MGSEFKLTQIQGGPCAFSNACTCPGDRVRLPGTNRYYCPPHAAVMGMPSGQVAAMSDQPVRIAGRSSFIGAHPNWLGRGWLGF